MFSLRVSLPFLFGMTCAVTLVASAHRVSSDQDTETPAKQQSKTPQPKTDTYGDPLSPGAIACLGTMRLRHGSWTQVSSFSRDGKVLISTAERGGVRFWDVATGKLLDSLRMPERYTRTSALSPDGNLLAVATDLDVTLWNMTTRKPVRTLQHEFVSALAFTSDSQTLVTGGGVSDGSLRVWDVASGKANRLMNWHERNVELVLVAADNRTLVSFGSHRSKLHVCDMISGEEISTISEPSKGGVYAALLLADGKSLLLGGDNVDKKGGSLAVYDILSGKPTRTLDSPTVISAVLAPDGKSLYAWGGGTVRVWDLAASKELRQFKVRGVVRQISPDGRTLAGTAWSAVELWDSATGKPLHETDGHVSLVNSVAFGADAKTLASSSSEEGVVRLWDVTTGKPLQVIAGHEGDRPYIRAVLFLSDGSGVISGANDSTLRLWDPATGKEIRKFLLGGRQQILSMGLSNDGKRLLCLSAGFGRESLQTLKVFEVASGKEIFHRDRKLPEQYSASERTAFSPDGKAIIHRDGAGLAVCDVTTGKEIVKLAAPDRLAEPYAFSPDGKLLAVRGSTPREEGRRHWTEFDMIFVFDITTGKAKAAFPAERTNIHHQPLLFSPDGKALASVENQNVRLLDVASGKDIWRSRQLDDWMQSIAFSPDGSRLACGLDNGSILIWELKQSPAK